MPLTTPTLGAGTWVHADPSQCSNRVWLVLPSRYCPPAQMSFDEAAKIASKLMDGPGDATGTDAHFEPFQWAMPSGPAAHTLVSEIASIAKVGGAPLVASHFLPFQCAMMGLNWLATQTSDAD